MRDDNNLLANDGGSHDHDPELLITSRFYSYLTVFSEFEPNHVTPTSLDKIQHPYEGEKVLAEVLKNTQHIVEHIELIPKNEADIYKAVYWFVKLVFASSRRINKSRFIKSFSTYKPDLLIPELNIAVEYKLIRTPKDLATHIDQVKIDADNYTGDPEYNKFYAVFYICEQKITTESSFLLAWEEKNFPDSWKPILVFGAKL